jgi:PadR family transcriptional regulator AphA
MAPGLSTASYALLGLLAIRDMSGYDIKAFADGSLRHFWAISYGQIYPELRQLEELGLVESEEAAVGGRRRTIYRPTARGREELETWLAEPVESAMEVRDELLLRFFLSDQATVEDRERLLQTMAKRHQDMARKLVNHRLAAAGHADNARLEVLDFGIALHQFCGGWFGRLLEEG